MIAKRKYWYPATVRSAPYVNPYTEFNVVLADIHQVKKTKLGQEIYLSSVSPINTGDSIICEWHTGLNMYKEVRTINQDLHTDESKCFGGFYTVNILPTNIQ